MRHRFLRAGLLAAAAALAMASPAWPEPSHFPQSDYDKVEGCMGVFDGATSIMMLLAPKMENVSQMVKGVIDNKKLSDDVKGALRKIEAAQPSLDKLEAGAAYSVAKRPWDDMASQDASVQLPYWKANGGNTPECEALIMRVVAIAGLMDIAP